MRLRSFTVDILEVFLALSNIAFLALIAAVSAPRALTIQRRITAD